MDAIGPLFFIPVETNTQRADGHFAAVRRVWCGDVVRAGDFGGHRLKNPTGALRWA